MNKENKIKELINKPKLASKEVENKIGVYRKFQIANILNISRPTLDKRLINHDWKIKEIELIVNNLYI